MNVEDQIAEGDKVATRWTGTMTHHGKTVTLTGITIDRFEGDKIVEAWRSRDMLSLLRQTGRIEPPRVYRRLHSLRGWSHGKRNPVLARSS